MRATAPYTGLCAIICLLGFPGGFSKTSAMMTDTFPNHVHVPGKTPISADSQTTDSQAIQRWLLCVAALILIMVMVGGATRLTGSGLSMTDWRPVTGVIPPIGETAWAAEFAKYQQSPEFKLKNFDMGVEDFKGIYWWEWGHRLLGRLIGLAYAVPLLIFWLRGKIPTGFKPRMLALFVLGGGQGLLGWYMVQSGLVDEPAVSHFRLAAHLSLALFLFSALLWTRRDIAALSGRAVTTPTSLAQWGLLGLTALQIVLGALVAGLKAGYIAGDWPLMNGQWVPDGLLLIDPVWRNMVDNALTVQFLHRMTAYSLIIAVGAYALHARRTAAPTKPLAMMLLSLCILQSGLGIATLIFHVPVWLGTLHQGVAVLVLGTAVTLVHRGAGPVLEVKTEAGLYAGR